MCPRASPAAVARRLHADVPCIIDDIGEPEEGRGMISDSNHILQARLGAGTYQIRVAAVAGPGTYRVTIHLNEEAQCYEEHCMK